MAPETASVSPVDVTVNRVFVKDVEPMLPVASPENVNVIWAADATKAADGSNAKLRIHFMCIHSGRTSRSPPRQNVHGFGPDGLLFMATGRPGRGGATRTRSAKEHLNTYRKHTQMRRTDEPIVIDLGKGNRAKSLSVFFLLLLSCAKLALPAQNFTSLFGLAASDGMAPLAAS
jgi:hypothetical protein